MTALTVYLQNTWFRLKERQEGQTMAEYALILGLIAIFVMVAVFFLGGKIKELFERHGSSVENAPTGSARSSTRSTRRWPPATHRCRPPPSYVWIAAVAGPASDAAASRPSRTFPPAGLARGLDPQGVPRVLDCQHHP